MMQSFTKSMKNLITSMIHNIHTAIPGKIVSFDPDKCEAAVLPYGKFKKPNGEKMDYPKIPGVPVYFPQGAGQKATIAYPVKANDECLLLFAEQALDTWRENGESDTDLRFDLQNAIAIVGLFAKPNRLVKEACDENALILAMEGERIKLKAGEISIHSTGDVNITAGGIITMRDSRTT